MEVLNMMFIDWTSGLSSILIGLDVALIVSAVAIICNIAVSTWVSSLWHSERPRITWHRPMWAR
jgi:hypothetical protein